MAKNMWSAGGRSVRKVLKGTQAYRGRKMSTTREPAISDVEGLRMEFSFRVC